MSSNLKTSILACSLLDMAAASEDWCRTYYDVKIFKFTWTIHNFSVRRESNAEGIESSIFPAECDETVPKWKMRVYPRGSWEENNDYLALDIVLFRGTKVKVKAKLAILNDKKEKFKTIETRTRLLEQGESFYLKDFITRQALTHANLNLLPQDTLTIFCEVNVINQSFNTSGKLQTVKFKLPPNSLGEDLEALFENKTFSDVKLIADGRELKAHKAILAARSRVFAAMFQHEMQEHISNSVPITDVQYEVLEEMLRYMYTDKVSNLSSRAEELLTVADKYEINNLKVLCEEYLLDKISVENAAFILILADQHNGIVLKAETLKFIVQNASAIVHTQAWKDMVKTHADLVAEAFCAMADNEEVPRKRNKQ